MQGTVSGERGGEGRKGGEEREGKGREAKGVPGVVKKRDKG